MRSYFFNVWMGSINRTNKYNFVLEKKDEKKEKTERKSKESTDT
jgi:hypothetical protein